MALAQRVLFFLLLPFTALCQTVPITATNTNPISFTIPQQRQVSIGAYNTTTGQLLATITANQTFAKGKHTIYWNGRDDNGNILLGTYRIRILSDSVTILPAQGIGNTSDSTSGSTVLHGYSPPSDMVQVGSKLYISDGFNEANQSIFKVDTAHPNQKVNIPYNGIITGQFINNLATDGNLVYIAATGYQKTDNFVYAITPPTDAEHVFPSGASHTSYAARVYTSVFDLNNSAATGNCTGLAVQQSGNYLFVAHSGLNVINVYNKTTGALVRVDAISAPGKLHLESDSKLWVGLGTTAQSYTVNSDGSLTHLLTIFGFQNVVAISHKGSNVYIEDAGTNQQIHLYNSSTGTPGGTLLQSGGYTATSVVANDRVYIQDLHTVYPCFITFLSDGTMWTADPGNYRALHFNNLGVYQNQIQYLGVFYSCNAIGTRIFANFLEFSYNYGTEAWALTNNYGYALPTTYNGSSVIYTYEPNQIFTLSNGGTYCLWRNSANQNFFAELSSTGFTPFATVQPASLTWNPDGTFSTGTLSGTVQTFKQYAQTGYSGRQPILSNSPTTIASYNIGSLFPRAGNSLTSQPIYVKTSTNNLIVISPNYATARASEYHLGAVRISAPQQLQWSTGQPTFTAYRGTMPSNNKFDIGNGAGAQAGTAAVSGNIIGWNFHGEGWKGGQTNFLNFFYENGLMIGQAGTSTVQTTGTEAPVGLTGNSLVLNMVSNGGNIHTWEGDESRHSMLCHYIVSNLASIHIDSLLLTVSNRVYVTPTNNRIDLLAGNISGAPLVNGVNGWTRSPTTDGANMTTLVRRDEADLNKSPDVYVKVSASTGSYNITRVLPGVSATNWELSGSLDLSIAPFQNIMTVNLNDVNGKVLAQFSFAASGSTLKFNGATVKVGFLANVTYQPMRFEMQRVGSQVYMICVINEVTYTSLQSIVDGSGNVARPGSLSVQFTYTGVSAGPGISLNNLFFNYQ